MSHSVVHRDRSSRWPMVSVDEALHTLCQQCTTPFNTIQKDAWAAVGFVLAEDVQAVEPHPPFRASIMDGYAVVAADGAGVRHVLSASTAGIEQMSVSVQPGTCVRVSTGAPVPDGADAVVKVEDTTLVKHDVRAASNTSADDCEELEVDFKVAAKVGQDIRPVGCDIAAGEVVVQKGACIRSAELGVLSLIGRTKVLVYEKPTVAVMSTGNELLDARCTDKLKFGQIRDSNRPQLLALLKQFGYETLDAGIVKDDLESVVSGLEATFSQADVLITSGGVSMGEKDLLKTILTDKFGFTIHFARVKMKPGKPTTFATGVWKERRKIVFALPGNPVSSWVCAHVFVAPALRASCGHPPHAQQWPVVKCKVESELRLDPRPEYQRAVLLPPDATTDANGMPKARTTGPNQMSSRLTSAATANLLLRLPGKTDEKQTVKAGELVDALVINLW